VKLGIGGFSMGAAVALHSAACYAHGKFASGIPYPITLNAVISLSGWLPCSRSNFDILSIDHLCHKLDMLLIFFSWIIMLTLDICRTLRGKMESSHIAVRRAASLPILLGHGRGDDDVDSKTPEIQYILLDNKFVFS
jgi:lysophospholipase-2